MGARRVLVIDSDPNFSDTLRRSLRPYGIDVEVVDDGSDGLQRAKEIGPELLFVAVELPEKAGYAICNKAKRGAVKNIPVVLATSSVSPADLESHKKLRYRADDYLDKRTLTAPDLLAKIDQLIGLGPAQETADADDLEMPVDAEEISPDEDGRSVDGDDGGGGGGAGGGRRRRRRGRLDRRAAHRGPGRRGRRRGRGHRRRGHRRRDRGGLR